MNKIKTYMLCLLPVLLFSCGEDYADFDNKAYLNTETAQTTFLIKQGSSTYSATLDVGIARPATEEIQFTFKADAALVATHNSIFGEDAVMLPTENYNFLETKATIAKESVRSTGINIQFIDIDKLDRKILYVLPVTIAGADNIGLLESARTHYYLFKAGALINWAADIEQNYFPITWQSTVNAMSELTIESMLYLRQATREGSDSNIMSFFGVEGTFLMRLGDTFDAGQIMMVAPGGNYPTNANDRTYAPVGRWFHVAITLDTSRNLRIYVDGEQKSVSTISSGTINLSSSCHIGKSYNDNRYWPGLICETRLWNIVRTADEIAESVYYVNPESAGLVAYWKFDEGNGNTIIDHTGNNNAITANTSLKWTSISLPE